MDNAFADDDEQNDEQQIEQMIEHDLIKAKRCLENSSFAIRLMDLLGEPIERGLRYLPEQWFERIQQLTSQSLYKALNVVLKTFPMQIPALEEDAGTSAGDDDEVEITKPRSYPLVHRFLITLTGSIGGFFGLPGMAVELPVSTMLTLRSIMAIAQAEGENLYDIETKLACLEVFSLGIRDYQEDQYERMNDPWHQRQTRAENGYFIMRSSLAGLMQEASEYFMMHSGTQKVADYIRSPVIRKLVSVISKALEIDVSAKAMAEAIPVVGAATGAAINNLFLHHFQQVACGHFIIRRLERGYGQEQVQEWYQNLAVT